MKGTDAKGLFITPFEGLFIYSRQKGTDAKDAMLYVMRRGLFITRSRTGNLLKRYAIC
jgi:hypothetical protein